MLLLAAAPAIASANDARIASRLYEPSTVVPLKGRTGFQSTVQFAEGERIENIAVGDSSGWQITPNKRADLLFLKPVARHARTNMTVVTDRHTYLFDLDVTPAGPPLYVMRFTYPDPPKLPPAPEPVEAAVAAPTTTPADLNFAWKGTGPKRLLPERRFDDGHATYLAWASGVMLPAILTIGPDGSEGAVNYTVKGDFVVIDGVPPKLILRSGKESALLTNLRAPAAQPTLAER
jgi:type IV secretion system protein VirB9